MSPSDPADPAARHVPEVAGHIVLARRPDGAGDIWPVLMHLAASLDPTQWCLVGGQMVAFRAALAQVASPRTSDDLDILSNLYVHPDAVARCARARPRPGLHTRAPAHTSGHRFTRDRLIVDILAPDHPPEQARLRTAAGRTTIQVPGGAQALRRSELVVVEYADQQAHVPVPNLLGALVLKADATRLFDPDRHLTDVALLASLVTDPFTMRDQLAGSDRKRLRAADSHLHDIDHRAWRALGQQRQRAAFATWRVLVEEP